MASGHKMVLALVVIVTLALAVDAHIIKFKNPKKPGDDPIKSNRGHVKNEDEPAPLKTTKSLLDILNEAFATKSSTAKMTTTVQTTTPAPGTTQFQNRSGVPASLNDYADDTYNDALMRNPRYRRTGEVEIDCSDDIERCINLLLEVKKWRKEHGKPTGSGGVFVSFR